MIQWLPGHEEPPTLREIDTRLATLKAAHRALDERIDQLTAEGQGSELELQRLKKQKLALKDRIAYLMRNRHPDIIA
ncbi:YdcH family protein [Geminicoccaceae bacterium 1502E]|nr:YdcH family protein [Geminicoccaceae bacterium 1502E]